MIHHVSVGTNDIGRSKRFYDAVLPIVGIMPMAEDEGGLGTGAARFTSAFRFRLTENLQALAMALTSRSLWKTIRWSIASMPRHSTRRQ